MSKGKQLWWLTQPLKICHGTCTFAASHVYQVSLQYVKKFGRSLLKNISDTDKHAVQCFLYIPFKVCWDMNKRQETIIVWTQALYTVNRQLAAHVFLIKGQCVSVKYTHHGRQKHLQYIIYSRLQCSIRWKDLYWIYIVWSQIQISHQWANTLNSIQWQQIHKPLKVYDFAKSTFSDNVFE